MSATIEATLERLHATRQAAHDHCVVCGRNGHGAMGLDCRVNDDGSVSADFDGRGEYAGYHGILHGGVISALADGTMTNCLFARGIQAVTGELTVRFRLPIKADGVVTITARLLDAKPPLYCLQADITQAGKTKVTAKAKFMDTANTQT